MLNPNEAERDGFEASGADAEADGSEDAEAVATGSDEAVKLGVGFSVAPRP